MYIQRPAEDKGGNGGSILYNREMHGDHKSEKIDIIHPANDMPIPCAGEPRAVYFG